ncbi:MAG: hypothetical protein AB2L07_04900 [Thermoanaerobaculaceae bacterium]
MATPLGVLRHGPLAASPLLAAPAWAEGAGGASSGCVWLVVLAVLLGLTVVRSAVGVLALRRHGVHAGALGIALSGLGFALVVAFVVVAGTLSPLITPEPAPRYGRPVELALWTLVGLGFFLAACAVETAVLGLLLRRPWARPGGLPDVPVSSRLLAAAVGNVGFLVLCLVVGTGSCLRGLQ